MQEFNADPRQFDVNRKQDDEAAEYDYSVALNDEADTVVYVDEENHRAKVYTSEEDVVGTHRQSVTVPLDLIKAVAVESDL